MDRQRIALFSFLLLASASTLIRVRKFPARRQCHHTGEIVDVPTLIVLGAAGGLLRGAVDLYTRFVSWQSIRLTCLQAGRQAPRFREYFDPSTDIVAPAVHTVMGAGAAVLFGTTGQISGAYAALVVGMSAPMLLTQLTRVQTVNEVVTGNRQPAESPEVVAGGPGTASTGPGAEAEASGAAGAVDASRPSLPAEPRPAASVVPPRTAAAPDESPRPVERPLSSPSRPAAAARTQEFSPGERTEERRQFPEPTIPGDTSLAADPSDGAGSGLDGRGTPRWRQGPAIGEEGL